MNLETFLKRIPVQLHPTSHHEEPRGRAEFVQPPELSHNERDYKTTNSIGTFGSSEVQDEHSMVESRFQGGSALPPFNTFEQPYQMRNSTLEDELNNIDKLKQMYESKINNGDHRRSRGAFRSIEKSSDGRSHSNEKHTLKPSNTPSFVKQYSSDENGCDSPQQNIKRRQSQNRLRKLYEQASLKSEKRETGMPINNSSARGDVATGIDEETLQQDSPVRKPRKVAAQQLMKPLESQRSAELQLYTARLQEELKEKISELEYKSTKLEQVELQNQQYKEKLKEVMRENLRLRDSNEKQRDQKEQLESLLKELLFEREREKNQREKANQSKTNRSSNAKEQPPPQLPPQREPMKQNRNVTTSPNHITGNNASFYQIPSTSGNKQQRQVRKKNIGQQNHDSINFDSSNGRSARLLSTMRSRNTDHETRNNRSQLSEAQDDREEKKVKVQNILDRLKIKISRY